MLPHHADLHTGTIEKHPDGGWQVAVGDTQLVGSDGRGLTREEAEMLLEKLDSYVAAMN